MVARGTLNQEVTHPPLVDHANISLWIINIDLINKKHIHLLRKGKCTEQTCSCFQ